MFKAVFLNTYIFVNNVSCTELAKTYHLANASIFYCDIYI